MSQILIGSTLLSVKDYECGQDGTYLPKGRLRLWLYVNLTSRCNAACPFCVNPPREAGPSIDPAALDKALGKIAPFVSGVSFTGGEPMLDVALLERAIEVVDERVDPAVPIDMVTNGTGVHRIPRMRGVERLATIHVSRHAADDDVNRALMGWADAPSKEELSNAFGRLPDHGCTVLNCVLQKGGVHDRDGVADYLEMAAGIGAANVSFIGMMGTGRHCQENRVSPDALGIEEDERFCVWSRFRDHGFCRCVTGDYRASTRFVRFYYRCPTGASSPRYCRQLVFGADNTLRQGFGNAPEIPL